MTDTAELNFTWAWAIFDGLVANGVKRVFISPGSRSTPLALAASRHPDIETRIVLDERTAAFMALGAARCERQPAALVATSGTAVSQWLPAVTEADLSRTPLILLSADRPPELHQCGANQTIQQRDLFGQRVRFSMELPVPGADLLQTACRFAAQAAATARWPLQGPVHLNIPFREPLVPTSFNKPQGLALPSVSRPVLDVDQERMDQLALPMNGREGIIICGPETGNPLPAEEITALASRLKAPVLADPLSNLRWGSHQKGQIISHYDACLRQPGFREQVKPAWVLRFGAMPVSKVLMEFLQGLDDCSHILVDPDGRWPDSLHHTTELIQADPARTASALADKVKPASGKYLGYWQQREQESMEILAGNQPMEADIIGSITGRLPAHCSLFCGNSLPVRQLDWFSGTREAPLRIVCNRGASGIDGNIASLLGMAVSTRPVVGLVGDLSLIHDIGALTETEGLNATILVLDNGGGAIFDHLPQSRLDEHEALFTTPRSVDLEAAARAFGLGYRKLQPLELDEALDEALGEQGVRLLHVMLDRERSLKEHRALWRLLSE